LEGILGNSIFYITLNKQDIFLSCTLRSIGVEMGTGTFQQMINKIIIVPLVCKVKEEEFYLFENLLEMKTPSD
jgi:hypothetical protein